MNAAYEKCESFGSAREIYQFLKKISSMDPLLGDEWLEPVAELGRREGGGGNLKNECLALLKVEPQNTILVHLSAQAQKRAEEKRKAQGMTTAPSPAPSPAGTTSPSSFPAWTVSHSPSTSPSPARTASPSASPSPAQTASPSPSPTPVRVQAASSSSTPVQPKTGANNFCTGCGKPLAPGAKFCSSCGKNVGGSPKAIRHVSPSSSATQPKGTASPGRVGTMGGRSGVNDILNKGTPGEIEAFFRKTWIQTGIAGGAGLLMYVVGSMIRRNDIRRWRYNYIGNLTIHELLVSFSRLLGIVMLILAGILAVFLLYMMYKNDQMKRMGEGPYAPGKGGSPYGGSGNGTISEFTLDQEKNLLDYWEKWLKYGIFSSPLMVLGGIFLMVAFHKGETLYNIGIIFLCGAPIMLVYYFWRKNDVAKKREEYERHKRDFEGRHV